MSPSTDQLAFPTLVRGLRLSIPEPEAILIGGFDPDDIVRAEIDARRGTRAGPSS